MKFLILTICLILATINSALGLKCWMCMGSLQSDCFRGVEESMTIQDCDASTNETLSKVSTPMQVKVAQNADEVIVTRCVNFIFTESGSKVFVRGCGWIYEDVDICEYMDDLIELHGCESCNENLCNTNPLLKK